MNTPVTERVIRPGETDVLAAITDPVIKQDPYPFLDRVREQSPVHRNPTGGVWFVSRHADALRVLRDPLFRAPSHAELVERFPRYRTSRALRSFLDSMVVTNPPEHTRLRKATSQYLSPRRTQHFRAICERHCDRLLPPLAERLRDGETVDLHADLVYPFSWNVISDVVGVPAADRPALAACALPAIAAVNPGTGEQQLQQADDASAQLETYFAALLAHRRGDPACDPEQDLASCLAGQLSERDAVSALWILWTAGYESTVGGIDTGVLAMLTHHDQARFLDGTPQEADAFVTECLRHDPPVSSTGTPRMPSRPVELSGVLVPPEADVRVLVGAANRDPEAFAEPHRFLPGRTENAAPVTFGHGPHYCLGAGLAKIEMATLLTRLRRELPGLTLAAPPRRREDGALRCFASLHVSV
ncbi:cytochrome P450 [Streptomyces rectiverticillatus]|uniref:cytochrome P450 n=1 Tax=Streptomyces rectiverticillatus TaxID=173860 RepID=UPI0015C2C2B3|nr:cytochrome P450 [Streptomyces rectiverticillatus]QLE73180.1 cytochrome P450 [Streptomyces rectiverticillatus]